MAIYEAKNFDDLIGMEGFSDQLLKNHFTLYNGYVTNTNKVAEFLDVQAKEGAQGTPQWSELRRRFGWEFNGMRLHEIYFGNLTKNQKAPDSAKELRGKIATDFSSYDIWSKDFKATGALRGIGWVALAYDKAANRLFNVWVGEHHVGNLAGAKPILLLDMWEHAFMIDYGLKKADYIEAFFKNINWEECEKRFQAATSG